jgi:hypothetical protein
MGLPLLANGAVSLAGRAKKLFGHGAGRKGGISPLLLAAAPAVLPYAIDGIRKLFGFGRRRRRYGRALSAGSVGGYVGYGMSGGRRRRRSYRRRRMPPRNSKGRFMSRRRSSYRGYRRKRYGRGLLYG